MASWQTHLGNLVLRLAKKSLAKSRDQAVVDALRSNMKRSIGRFDESCSYETVSLAGVSCEWVMPKEQASNTTAVYFHGGAYVAGSPASHRDFTTFVAKEAKAKVLAVDYRLAPEYLYPAAIDDACNIYDELLKCGVSSENIVIGGDSAGGNLALCLLQKLSALNKPMPKSAFLFSPWADLTHSGGSITSNEKSEVMLPLTTLQDCAEQYAPGLDKALPLISPVFADFSGFPPMLIHASKVEILKDDSVRIANNAEKAGVDVTLRLWDKVPHAFPVGVKFLPEAREAAKQTADFIRA